MTTMAPRWAGITPASRTVSSKDLQVMLDTRDSAMFDLLEANGIDGKALERLLKKHREGDPLANDTFLGAASRGEIPMAAKAQHALSTSSVIKMLSDEIVLLDAQIDGASRTDSLKAQRAEIDNSLKAARITAADLREHAMGALMPQVADSMARYNQAQAEILADEALERASVGVGVACWRWLSVNGLG